MILSQKALTPTSVDAVAAAPWHLTDKPRGLPVQGSTGPYDGGVRLDRVRAEQLVYGAYLISSGRSR